MRNDDAEMSRQVEAARRFSDGALRMLTTQITLALYQGRLARAQELATQYASEAGSTLGLKGSAASVWSNVAQSAAAYGDTQSARAAVRNSLDLERNLGSLLSNAIAIAVSGDAQMAKRLLDEAVKMPGAANDDAQRGFKFADALIRWRQGDKPPQTRCLYHPTPAISAPRSCSASSSSPTDAPRTPRRASSRSSIGSS